MGNASGLGAARGSISIDTSDLSRVQGVARSVGQSVSASLGQISTGTKKAESGINSLGSTLTKVIGIGVGVEAAKRLAELAVGLAETAAKAEQTKIAFEGLAKSAGQSGENILATMRRASGGMISDSNLVLSANRAMLLGVADSGEKLGQLLEVARVRGQAMGLDVTTAFDNIVTGLGRLSPRILDNLGIVIDEQKAYNDYANSIGRSADSLTNAEKKAVLFNQVMRDSQSLLANAGNSTDTAAGRFQKFQASIENTKEAVGQFVIAAGLPEWLESVGKWLEDATKKFGNFREEVRRFRTESGFAPILNLIGGLTPQESKVEGARGQIRGLENIKAGLTAGLSTEGAPTAELQAKLADVNTSLQQLNAQLGQLQAQGLIARGVVPQAAPNIGPTPVSTGGGPAVLTGEQTSAIIQWSQDVQKIEQSANTARIEATTQYEQQRSDTIAQYEQSIARDVEDYGRQRARAETQFSQQVSDMQRDAGRREAQWQRDLQDSIAKIQSDGAKRLSAIEADYHDNREKAERDHRDRLFDAAAHLDAQAVLQEQKQFARQTDDQKKEHDKRVNQEKENLQERIDQENQAHAKRLADAREADAERLSDMQRNFDEQRKQEDDDRTLRLARQAEDHQHQLEEMDKAQSLRLQQIADHATQERKALDEAFAMQMNSLSLIVNGTWKAILDAANKDSLDFFRQWRKDFDQIRITGGASLGGTMTPTNPIRPVPTFASGGTMPHTGLAQLHAGEYVLNSQTAAAVRAAMGGSFNQQQLVQAVAGPNLSIGGLNIYAQPGMNPHEIADVVEDKLIEVFRRLAA